MTAAANAAGAPAGAQSHWCDTCAVPAAELGVHHRLAHRVVKPALADFVLSGYRSEFCARLDGSVVSVHAFQVALVWTQFDFDYAIVRCECGAEIRGSRPTRRPVNR